MHLNNTMNKATHSYYPPTCYMVAHDNNATPGIPKKPTMELVISHDQWLDTGSGGKSHQQPLQQSTRCTTCNDTSGNTIFYRPYIPLATLFQGLDPCDHSSETFIKRRRSLEDDTTISYQRSLFNIENGSSQQHNTHLITSTITRSDENNNNNNGDDDDDSKTILSNGNMDDRIYTKHGCSPGMDDHTKDTDDTFGDYLDYQRWVVLKQRQSYVTLYNTVDDCPVWSLVEQDGHFMTLLCHQLPHKFTLMTTSTFSFVWEGDRTEHQQPLSFLSPYRWQMQLADDGNSLELLCKQYQPHQTTTITTTEKSSSIALLDKQGTRLILFGNDNNDNKAANLVGGGSQANPVFTTPVSSEPSAAAAVVENAIPCGDDTSSKNPFRTTTTTTPQDYNDNHHAVPQRKLDSLDTFLVLSGLLLYDLIDSQLRTLESNSNGMTTATTPALTMMIERQQEALKKEDALFYKQYQYYMQQKSAGKLMDLASSDNHGTGMLSLDKKGKNSNHPGGDDNNARWSASSAGSLQSLELDPGLWRCWWQWLPWCTLGGCCDRAYIKIRGIQRQRHHHHRSRMTRQMQGWQQQQE